MRKTKNKWEYGDFQTSIDLARQCCKVIQSFGFLPKTIIEPTCGYGNFALAAAEYFESARKIYAFDINKTYIEQFQERIPPYQKDRISPSIANFFTMQWDNVLDSVEWPLLIIGNPPWVTSAELGRFKSKNLPEKANFQKYAGLDALTGKSNFDISEWMLLKQIEWLEGRSGTLAMLCKTAVARKLLKAQWQTKEALYNSRIYSIDAFREFSASVDACLFILESAQTNVKKDCVVFPSLQAIKPVQKIGYRNGYLVSDAEKFDTWKILFGKDDFYIWRSGLKHDCSSVMELTKTSNGFINGLGNEVDLEDEYVYPLLKSSEVASGKRSTEKERYVIVTQKHIGEETDTIRNNAPRTWQYLQTHQGALQKRGSKIYKKYPPFSIFGIGSYSFQPWKVAISGLYKYLSFMVVEPKNGKPTMVDDTVYFIPCRTEEEANTLAKWLNSDICREFLESMIFWKDKRPITASLLKRLNIRQLAKEHGEESLYIGFTEKSE